MIKNQNNNTWDIRRGNVKQEYAEQILHRELLVCVGIHAVFMIKSRCVWSVRWQLRMWQGSCVLGVVNCGSHFCTSWSRLGVVVWCRFQCWHHIYSQICACELPYSIPIMFWITVYKWREWVQNPNFVSATNSMIWIQIWSHYIVERSIWGLKSYFLAGAAGLKCHSTKQKSWFCPSSQEPLNRQSQNSLTTLTSNHHIYRAFFLVHISNCCESPSISIPPKVFCSAMTFEDNDTLWEESTHLF